ncbi:uncharacterized protein [Drosophila bipectinata]|uniref:uncharacterized protein n=1 Tax=Drosophila bipectinata TaxID=42026 RepID=UPI0038B251CF
MTTETYLDLTYDRGKGSKRPLRPKLLKLTDVTIPHRSRKKNKVKTKDRSATTVRERIYDDPAYTEDISHLANPMRRSSISGKPDHKSVGGSKHQLAKELHQYVTGKQGKLKGSGGAGGGPGGGAIGAGPGAVYDCDSSSSDNEPLEPMKATSSMTRRVRSLERSLDISMDKKSAPKRSSKQKRNLSLDNSRHLATRAEGKQSQDMRRKLPPEAGQAEDDVYSTRSSAQESAATLPVEADAATKLAIGKRFLRGEIGIKSFNYYLLKEGLKSSKKIDKPGRNEAKLQSRSEENIYEEIFFKDTPKETNVVLPEKEGQNHLPASEECEICMEQCSKDNCEFCLAGSKLIMQVQPQQQQHPQLQESQGPAAGASALPAAHILEFQSYNPNNPGVYKIETTPVAITGDYNPILQFQQSSATTSTSTTTTPSEQHLQQQIYGGYYLPHLPPNQRSYHPSLVGNPITNHYATAGGSLLLAQVTGAATPPRRPQQQQQHYILGTFQNGGAAPGTASAGAASLQRLNTKSSSSSDSLPYHKYNTMARLEANVFASPATGDLYYAVGGAAPLHPLMYAASRPIGGSQILVDSYDPPQMYKSDSKASILSEFSLRSSDNSQRYARHPHRRHGGGRVSDSSLFSVYSNSGQRRYFGSSDSRFGYDCRRCSLDGVIGMGMGMSTTAGVGGGGGNGHMATANTAPEKCSYSDNCRYECRNCDCSSNYFSSDFDEVYGSIARGGSSGIPRKTKAGTLPSSGQEEPQMESKGNTPPPQMEQPYQAPLDLKQNKYAQDFFKHVNDVKRSIYQSEMQRNNSLESSRRNPRSVGLAENSNTKSSPKRAASQEPSHPEPVVTTLPLSRGRPLAGMKPTPAPRTSLQAQPTPSTSCAPRDPTPSKRKTQPTGRREYPSLDRLVASSTGTIPKRQNRTVVPERITTEHRTASAKSS